MGCFSYREAALFLTSIIKVANRYFLFSSFSLFLLNKL